MASIWRSGDDKSWAAAAALHPDTAAEPIKKRAARLQEAATQGRIASKLQRDVEMFKAVIAAMERDDVREATESKEHGTP